MINRELIRIKTIQLLYSYLLVENPFSLESQPSAPTKEKRFAYALYLDLLYMMTLVAEATGNRSGNALADTRFIRNILLDDKIKSIAAKSRLEEPPFRRVVEGIAQKIKESAIYRNYIKKLDEGTTDESVWKDIFEKIIMTDRAVNAEIATRLNYTLKGVDRMRQIMETTFSNFFASADNIADAVSELGRSMDKARELYFRLLALPIAITTYREREIDNAQYKLLKNDEDINPNLRFIENEFVKFLRGNEAVQQGITKYRIDWLAENESLVKSLMRLVAQSDLYKEYLEFPATDMKRDCELWRALLRNLILVDDGFLEALEDKSVFWNDDLDVIGTFFLKSIKRLGDSEDPTGDDFVLPMFKDKEDKEFGARLASLVISKKDDYRAMILENLDNKQWEVDRLAFMDTVILMTALAEILEFPSIPLTVSFNEYIEISKYYSTPRSSIFINGVLGSITASLQQKGKLLKTFNDNKK